MFVVVVRKWERWSSVYSVDFQNNAEMTNSISSNDSIQLLKGREREKMTKEKERTIKRQK